MNILLRITGVLFIFIITTLLTPFTTDNFLINTIYVVSGIMFSVGMSAIFNFNLNGINNKQVINQVRDNINGVKKSFIFNFILSTLSFILDNVLKSKNIIAFPIAFKEKIGEINFSILFFLIVLYTIIYFIINFNEIKRLNDDIYDEVNKIL